MHTLIAFATQWGSQHGGINSFNTDFLSAFGVAYHLRADVICLVSRATEEEIEVARNTHVRLLPLPYEPQARVMSEAHAQPGVDEIAKHNLSFNPDCTVWLGHDRISGAAANAAARIAGGRSALIHHMSYDHYESFAEDSSSAYGKAQTQTDLFQKADIVLAVGPLLRDALCDRLARQAVPMLIPGLAEIEVRRPPNTFTAFLSGRLTDDAARIKQGHLGIAAFAQAHREARRNTMPEGLRRQPKMVLRGVDFDAQIAELPSATQVDPEAELKQFAEEYADGVINLQALPYTQDRERLYADLSAASVALMPSWHEGFGLVAWEAMAAGVPLIVSKNSGVYRLLQESHPAGPGCVYPIDVRGAVSPPFFHEEDLLAVAQALTAIGNKPKEARRKAGELRNMLEDYTWSSCAEEAAKVFDWPLQKGIIAAPAPEPAVLPSSPDLTVPVASAPHVPALSMPAKRWQPDSGMSESQLLRAEEALVPFDLARQPELDALNKWLDDTRWPQAVRLITAAGGLGKTRLALELCQQRLSAGWHAGVLDSDLEAKDMTASWQVLRDLNQPLLIVIDYAETRQPVLLALIKAMTQTAGQHPVRVLLLARDAGEWWDHLPSQDRACEALLSGYATSGPFRLPPLHATVEHRRQSYIQALAAYAQVLDVPPPQVIPELSGEHFSLPLYLQMSALLALYGERPTTAEGLTKALLNHERRYWRGLLANLTSPEPDRQAHELLALTTLAGGFLTPKEAQGYWAKASGSHLSDAEFSTLFHALVPLYPGKQGLQAVKPDLLGEALVGQAVIRPEGVHLWDAVLHSNAKERIRYHALTVMARLSEQRPDLHETFMEALVRHFPHCYRDVVLVITETTGDLVGVLAETAFAGLAAASKSQVAGLLKPLLRVESVQLAELTCAVMGYLAEKSRQRLEKKTSIGNQSDYATALGDYVEALRQAGRDSRALSCAGDAVKVCERLKAKNRERFEPAYGRALGRYALTLRAAGEAEEALRHGRQSLAIYRRLAQKDPDRYEPNYVSLLGNYAIYLDSVGQAEEALRHHRQALAILQRLAQKNSDRYEPNYAKSMNHYAGCLYDVGRTEEALEHGRQALAVLQRLAQRSPDRYEPDYASSLNSCAIYLDNAGQTEEALEHGRQALAIRQRVAEKNPERFAVEYLESMSLVHFLGWLCEQPDMAGDLPDLNVLPATVPPHQRSILSVLVDFGRACSATDQAIRAAAFRQVLSTWERLSAPAKYRAVGYARRLGARCLPRDSSWIGRPGGMNM